MSASVRGMFGGVPSTTQPMAGPWLSPQVVNLNSVPKVLSDIQGRVLTTAAKLPGHSPELPTVAMSGASARFIPFTL